MMPNIKKCVDERDIKGLRYIFIDSLDVDPTFDKYRSDYEYCKGLEGFFDEHNELTGLSLESNMWTMAYWQQLKIDLTKNFSQKRFEHMISVAKVVHADKVERLLKERKAQDSVSATKKPLENKSTVQTVKKEDVTNTSHSRMSKEDENRIRERQREIEEANRKVEEKQKAERERIEEVKRKAEAPSKVQTGSNMSKKWLGIAIAIIVVLIVAVFIMVLQWRNPPIMSVHHSQ